MMHHKNILDKRSYNRIQFMKVQYKTIYTHTHTHIWNIYIYTHIHMWNMCICSKMIKRNKKILSKKAE